MTGFHAPERPTSPAQDRSSRTIVSRGLRISAVGFGVVFGAYAAQKLQTPIGLDDDGDAALFWVFSLAVMALLAFVFVAVALLLRAIRRP
jgi:hypothetical protein